MAPPKFRLNIKQHILHLVIDVASLSFALWLFDVRSASLLNVLEAILLIFILQQLLQPVLSWVVGTLGVVGILIVSLLSSPLIVWLALFIVPGIDLRNPIHGLFIGWIYALGLTIAQWISVSQSDDIFLAEVMRKNRVGHKPKTTSRPGFVFVQLDGVSWPVLDWQLKAGNLPNISRLINHENYTFRSWKTQLPSTTPASQAGILLGSHANIPAFRWYEKAAGELVVANQAAGAALIEKRLSTGDGLLVDGGVSVGNLFSGDAPTNIMVMSKLEGDRQSVKIMREYTHFFSSPVGFARSFILSVGEMVKEIYQARRQVANNVTPRIKRHGSYILLRAATNVVLRNLQTTIVIQNMMRGVNSLYVDYLDYDEIAHHAGIARAESLAALTGLDQVVGLLCKARNYAPRPYEIILLSDHGQSQGPTFKQLHNGKTLEEFVAELCDGHKVQASTEPLETQTSSRSLLALGSHAKNAGGAVARKLSRRAESRPATSVPPPAAQDIVVTGSGNLGNVWLNEIAGRATFEQITALYPRLIPKLLRTDGIGCLLLVNNAGKHLCISAQSSTELENNTTQKLNPLAAYPGHFEHDLLQLSSMNTAPDIAVISAYNKTQGEVYAFEELVGNHGGIGGWQTQGILLHPGHLKVPKRFMENGRLHDSINLHKVFKLWLADAKSNQRRR